MSIQANGKRPPDVVAAPGDQAIAALRSIPGLSVALRVIGALCILIGTGWGAAQILKGHPYLVLVLVGLAFLVVSLVACREGLISFLPADTQDFLLKKTFWDWFYDDSAVQNSVRKWVRVLLLSMEDGQSVGTVRTLVKDLDPTFVDGLLRSPWLEYLPAGAQRIILPEPCSSLTAMNAGLEAAKQGRSVSSTNIPTGTMSQPMNAAAIAKLLREKHDLKTRQITEAELGPTVLKAMAIEPMINAAARSAVKGVQVAAAAATVWFGTSALIIRREAVQEMLFRGLAIVGCARASLVNRDGDAQISKAGRISAALGCLSAGACIAVSVYYRRVASKWEVVGSSDDSTGTDTYVSAVKSEFYTDSTVPEDHRQAAAKFAAKAARARARAGEGQ